MNNWRTITGLEIFSAEERAQSDVLSNAGATIEGELQGVVNEARDCIQAQGTVLGPVGTIPDQIRQHVAAIAVWRSLGKLPGLDALMTKARQEMHDEGARKLEAVASGELRIVGPSSTVQNGGAWGSCAKQDLTRI